MKDISHFTTDAELAAEGITPEIVDAITQQAFDWYREYSKAHVDTSVGPMRCAFCGEYKIDEPFYPVFWHGEPRMFCKKCIDEYTMTKEVRK